MALGDGIRNFEATANVQQLGFAEFTADLLNRTADAVVSNTIKQIQNYAELIKELSPGMAAFMDRHANAGSVDVFLQDVFPNADGSDTAIQVGATYDFALYRKIIESLGEIEELPAPGEGITEEFTEASVAAIRDRVLERQRVAAQESFEQLQSLIELGYARVIFTNGNIRTRLIFSASARDQMAVFGRTATETRRNVGGALRGGIFGALGFLGGSIGGSTSRISVSTMTRSEVSSVEASATIMGEVQINFKTETFALSNLNQPQNQPT